MKNVETKQTFDTLAESLEEIERESAVAMGKRLKLLQRIARAAKEYAGPVGDCCMTGEATGELCDLHAALAELVAITHDTSPASQEAPDWRKAYQLAMSRVEELDKENAFLLKENLRLMNAKTELAAALHNAGSLLKLAGHRGVELAGQKNFGAPTGDELVKLGGECLAKAAECEARV